MKKFVDLTVADLERAAIWRYAGDTDDSAVVYATDHSELTGREHDTFIARTQFVLADGSQHAGFCSPSDAPDLEELQPVILTPDGPVYFWFAEPPSSEYLSRQWARLGGNADEIFPIHFRCSIPVGGTFVTGTITADDLTGAA
ncbi:MAG TPA: hypothetical protein VEZ11_17105 [Thermoanaerobaculia bacterium]|nr:hypothetical protein [Thermoanaerobaculia bacterium]